MVEEMNELLAALKQCVGIQSSGGNGSDPFVKVFFGHPGEQEVLHTLLDDLIARARRPEISEGGKLAIGEEGL